MWQDENVQLQAVLEATDGMIRKFGVGDFEYEGSIIRTSAESFDRRADEDDNTLHSDYVREPGRDRGASVDCRDAEQCARPQGTATYSAAHSATRQPHADGHPAARTFLAIPALHCELIVARAAAITMALTSTSEDTCIPFGSGTCALDCRSDCP